MKTIQNTKTGEIKRISDTEIKTSNWSYVPKQVWKEASRPKKVEKEKK